MMSCQLNEQSAYISGDISATGSGKSYHFVRPERQALHSVSIARHPLRQQWRTHLNFFNGLEYEPTVECDAMMASTGKKEMN